MAKKKQSPGSKLLMAIKSSNKVILAAGVLILIGSGIFAVNKYLDWRNVEDMRQLLADFEQLERDLEAETGEEFFIEANCGSVGKFATSYACSLGLYLKDGWRESASEILRKHDTNLRNEGCILLSEGSIFDDPKKNHFYCSISVPNSVRSEAEGIFYNYDVTPGRSF